MVIKLCLLVFVAVFHNYCAGELPVIISRGSFIKAIHGVTVYNDVELLHHFISGKYET